jgi:hypothetical protein
VLFTRATDMVQRLQAARRDLALPAFLAHSGEGDHRIRSKVIMGSGDRDHVVAGCCGLTGGATERA